MHAAWRRGGMIFWLGLLALSPDATARITEVTAVADMTTEGHKLLHRIPTIPRCTFR
jgi:hypothetical protein